MIENFSLRLTNWYNNNKRALPWRETNDSYAIWLSEVILQQTRVDQGMAYYQRFLSLWPTVVSLAAATEQEVLLQWQGLGYYSRARNLLHTARLVVEQHQGHFPDSYEELIKLKGIGPYTAAAIASIAFNKPHAVVDGNVQRVLSRLFGVTEPIDSPQGKKAVESIALQAIQGVDPATHNQAMMEFGALQCVPKSPDCHHCVFKNQCFAFSKGKVADLPLKTKKTKVVTRFFNYFIAIWHQQSHTFTAIQQRLESDIWKGLFEFPLIETSQEVEFEELIQSDDFNQIFDKQTFTLVRRSEVHKHQLTHRRIMARFYHLHFEQPPVFLDEKNVFLIVDNDFSIYPLPRLIDRYLQQNV